MKMCPFCAEEIQAEAIVCKHCGRDLPRPTRPRATSTVSAGTVALILVLSMAGGCGLLAFVFTRGSQPSPPGRVQFITPLPSSGNATHDKLMSMGLAARERFFAKYIETNGERCTATDRLLFRGFDSERTAYWSISCANNKKRGFSLSIAADAGGSVKMVDCGVLKMAKVDCFKTFDEEKVAR